MEFKITETMVRKLVSTVDLGLTNGLGEPRPGRMCVEAAVCYALGEPHSDGPSCVDLSVRDAKIRLNDAPWSSNLARARGLRAVAIAQLGSRGVIDSTKFAQLLTEYVIREIVPIALRCAAKANPSFQQSLETAAMTCEQDGDRAAARAAAAAAHAAAARAAAAAAAAASHGASSAAYAAAYAAYAADAADAAAYAAGSAADAADAADAAAYAAGSAAAAAAAAEKDSVLSLFASLMVRVLRECGSPGCDWLWLLDEIPVPQATEARP